MAVKLVPAREKARQSVRERMSYLEKELALEVDVT